MKKLLSFVLAAALCAPAFAQARPKIEQTLTAGDAKITLNYSAVAYNQGTTFTALTDKATPAEDRANWNNRLSQRPMVAFSTSVEVTCGDVKLAAGEYQVYPSFDDTGAVSMNFKMGEKVSTVKVKLEESGHESKRLLMCLYAEENGAGVYLSFGKKSGMMTFVPAAAPAKK
jgi:hypothetical protein